MIHCIVMQLFQGDTIVDVLITGTEEGLNDVLWDLQGSVSLVQILRRTLVVPAADNFFHAHR
jgi:hypothetical protein